MSHLSKLETAISNLDALEIAVQNLANQTGAPLVFLPGGGYVKAYYSEQSTHPDKVAARIWCTNGDTSADNNAPIGTRADGGYAVGLIPSETTPGTYSLAYDAWGLQVTWNGGDRAVQHGGVQWTSARQGGRSGHLAKGTLDRLLQEYALVVGELGAQAQGLESVREPQGDGDVLLRVAGAQPGTEIHLLARRDGSSTVSAWGFTGGACLHATQWLENQLGSTVDQHLHDEFYHSQEDALTVHLSY